METSIQELEKLVEDYMQKTEDSHEEALIENFWGELKPHLTSLLTSKDKEIERLQGELKQAEKEGFIAGLNYPTNKK